MKVGKIGTGLFLLGLATACAKQSEQPEEKYEPRVTRAPIAGAAKTGFYVNFDTVELCRVYDGYRGGFNVECHTPRSETEVDEYDEIRSFSYISNGRYTTEKIRVADTIASSSGTEGPRAVVPSDRERYNIVRIGSIDAIEAKKLHNVIESVVLNEKNYVGDFPLWPRIVDIEQGRLFPEPDRKRRSNLFLIDFAIENTDYKHFI